MHTFQPAKSFSDRQGTKFTKKVRELRFVPFVSLWLNLYLLETAIALEFELDRGLQSLLCRRDRAEIELD